MESERQNNMIPFNHNHYPYPSQRNSVYGKRGMVSTSHPLATEAGMAVFRKGGNAVDAALAAAAALCVVDPSSTAPGGDLFAIVYADGKLHGLNASGHSAEKMTLNEIKNRGGIPDIGVLPITVSGGPSGWAALSERFGQLSMREVFTPAVELTQGYPVDGIYTGAVNSYMKRLLDTGDPLYESWYDLFAPGRQPLKIGQTVCLPDLGETLSEIAETKSESFYRGRLARKIGEYIEQKGGLLQYEDFASYNCEWVEPVSINYRGYDVWELPPNGQGIAASIALNIMEGFTPVTHDDAFTVHRQIESMKLAFADASAYIADPNCLTVNINDLLSKKYAAMRRGLIEDKSLCPPPGEPCGGDTVYLCAADGEGNMISLIQSVAAGWGSGVVVPGTGVLMQNRGTGFSMNPEHPNCVGPRKRSYHTIIPGFITKDNAPVGPVGVMGGKMQPQGHLQVIMNMIDFGMNPQAALDAPRWFWQNDLTVWMETSWSKTVLDALTARGHKIVPGSFYGRGNIIIRSEDGSLCGGAEPRGGGSVMAF